MSGSGLLRMPRLGETMEEGRLVGWLVAPGTPFERGDPLLEVETDKTVVEFPALGPGVVTETLAEIGDTVAVGAPIARVDVGDGPDWTAEGDGEADPATGRKVVDLPMPRLGETMEEGVIVGWMVAPGAAFSRGDPLLEVETDKTVAEFPALADGVLSETLAGQGDRLPVGAPIARVEIDAADVATVTGAEERDHAEKVPAPAPTAPAATPSPSGRPRATPVARRLARQKGVDLAALSGTGRRGRIESRDVEAAGGAGGPDGQTLRGIAFAETGPANGTPVLFLHGFAADRTAWSSTASQLARAGRRCVAVDLPGHGATPLEAATAEDLSAPMSDFAGALFAGRPVHVVAHSLGAAPAVALASAGLARSLTLIAPAGLGRHIDADFIRGLANARGPGEVRHLLSRMTDGPTGLSEAAIAGIAAGLAKGRLRTLAESVLGAGGQALDVRPALAALASRIPVHLILGHRDRIVDWRDSVDVSPRIAVHHLPRSGHMPHWEAMAEVADILRNSTEAS